MNVFLVPFYGELTKPSYKSQRYLVQTVYFKYVKYLNKSQINIIDLILIYQLSLFQIVEIIYLLNGSSSKQCMVVK
jgi:hypothetical protein